RRLNPTTPSLRATPPRRGGEGVKPCPPRGGGRDATMSRTGGHAAPQPHHPGASRHPSSTRRGRRQTLPSSSRRAGRDNVADGWSCGAKTLPPRRCAPPLLDEEGKASNLALLVEEGGTRQCRGRVVLRRANPTTPALRATPPRRRGEGCRRPRARE